MLGTSSEPVLASVLRKLNQLGCQKGVSGLVLLMGYAINLDSTPIYLTLASVFILTDCRAGFAGGRGDAVDWH